MEKVVELKNERKLKVQEIFTSIKGIVEIYSDLYKPVQEFVDKNDLVKRELELNFQASVIESRFEESFFHYITHNISGTFCGKESGCKILKAIINKYDFNIEENVFYFIDEIIDSLEFDRRTKADSNKNKII